MAGKKKLHITIPKEGDPGDLFAADNSAAPAGGKGTSRKGSASGKKASGKKTPGVKTPGVKTPAENAPTFAAPSNTFPMESDQSTASLLKAAREAKGLALEDVSEGLRIRQKHLQAIEDGRISDLPGATYAIGFVRAYAEFLNLDHEELVKRFRSESEELEGRTKLDFPEPAPESRIPGGAILLISVLLAVLVYGGWYRLTINSENGHDVVSEVPDRLASLIWGESSPDEDIAPEYAATGALVENAEDSVQGEIEITQSSDGVTTYYGRRTLSQIEADADVAVVVIQEEEPAVPQMAQDSVQSDAAPVEAETEMPAFDEDQASAPEMFEPAMQSVTQDTDTQAMPSAQRDAEMMAEEMPGADANRPEETDQVPSAGSSAGNVYGEMQKDVRIVIRVTEDSWVQVRDANGLLILTRILHQGDTYRVPDDYGLTMLTGNAGAMEITVDGESVSALGPLGAIRRKVYLDPYKLKAGTAIAPEGP